MSDDTRLKEERLFCACCRRPNTLPTRAGIIMPIDTPYSYYGYGGGGLRDSNWLEIDPKIYEKMGLRYDEEERGWQLPAGFDEDMQGLGLAILKVHLWQEFVDDPNVITGRKEVD